jgi:hypothetical protein
MSVTGKLYDPNSGVRRVIIASNPQLHPFSNVDSAANNYYCLANDMKGFQIEVDLQALPPGVTIDQIQPNQVWWVEKRTSLYRLYLYGGIYDPAFRRINSTGFLPQLPITWASYYDTTTQIAPIAGTPYKVTFDTIQGQKGFTLVSGSQITATTVGTYMFQFTAQCVTNAGGTNTSNLTIWLRQNGINVPYTSGELSMYAKNPNVLASWNFIQKMNAGDYIEMVWSTDTNNSIWVAAQPAAANGYAPAYPNPTYGPEIPSWTMTVSQA